MYLGEIPRLLVPFPLMELNQVSSFPCGWDTARDLGSSGQMWPCKRAVGSPVWGCRAAGFGGGGPGGRSAVASRWERVPGTAVGLPVSAAPGLVPGVFPALPSTAGRGPVLVTTDAPSHSSVS